MLRPSDVPALTWSQRLAYAAPGFAFALVGIPVYVHLPKFYGDSLGVDLGFIGLAILASRLWDAVTDPTIGFLSDHTRSRLGRRRPWILLGALPLAVGLALLFVPPATDPARTAWWMAGWLVVTFLAWTSVQIPHAALGAELVPEHHARTALFAWRDGLWILGTLVAAVAPTVVRGLAGIPRTPDGEQAVFRILAAVYGPVLLLLPLWCVLVLREPRRTSVPATGPPWRSTIAAWRNQPFRIVLLAYAIGALGGALPATLLLFYVEHVLGAPELADAFLGLYFVVGFACLPLWPPLARRIGKKQAWIAAMLVSVAAFSGAAFLGRGQTWLYGAIVVASGIGFGAGIVLPASIVADTIDYDELRSGERREGLYYGLWAVVTKISAALGAAAALPAIQWAGYTPNAPQSEAVLQVLRVLYAGVPCACYLGAMTVAVRLPIDEARHAAIRQGLERRAAGLPFTDPLLDENRS